MQNPSGNKMVIIKSILLEIMRRLLQSGQFCISHRSKLLGWRFEYVNPEDGKQEHFSI